MSWLIVAAVVLAIVVTYVVELFYVAVVRISAALERIEKLLQEHK
jgi:hypothetical protein